MICNDSLVMPPLAECRDLIELHTTSIDVDMLIVLQNEFGYFVWDVVTSITGVAFLDTSAKHTELNRFSGTWELTASVYGTQVTWTVDGKDYNTLLITFDFPPPLSDSVVSATNVINPYTL